MNEIKGCFRNILLIIMAVLLPCAAGATRVGEIVTGNDDSGCFVSMDLESKTNYRVFTLSNPSRLVVDLDVEDQTRNIREISKCDYIKNIRHARFDKNWYRFVFDLSRDVTISNQSLEKKSNGNGQRLMAFVATEEGAQKIKDIKSRLSDESASVIEPLKTVNNLKQKNAEEEKAVELPVTLPPAKEKKKADKNKYKPIIVIDAGHGGIDPGAVGSSGTHEKDVVLEYAHALKKDLRSSGKYRVRLTRQGDVYVKLSDRLNMARTLEGDLFISLHADAAPERSARGLSVYTLSEQAAEKVTSALAAKNDKGDIIEGVNLTGKSQEVAGILIDLAQREKMNKSAEFASSIIGNMVARDIKLLNNTHRFAGYVVLKSADVPAVLVELGFLSSQDDEKLLQSRIYKKKVIEGIDKSIDMYFQNNPVYND